MSNIDNIFGMAIAKSLWLRPKLLFLIFSLVCVFAHGSMVLFSFVYHSLSASLTKNDIQKISPYAGSSRQ